MNQISKEKGQWEVQCCCTCIKSYIYLNINWLIHAWDYSIFLCYVFLDLLDLELFFWMYCIYTMSYTMSVHIHYWFSVFVCVYKYIFTDVYVHVHVFFIYVSFTINYKFLVMWYYAVLMLKIHIFVLNLF